MKICPQCRAEFETEMNFCLQDGTPLVAASQSSEPTLNLPSGQNLPPTQNIFNQQSRPTVARTDYPTETLSSKPTDQTPNFVMFEPSSASSKKASMFLFGAIGGGLLLIGTAVAGIWTILDNRQTSELKASKSNIANVANTQNENTDVMFPDLANSTSSNNKNSANVKTNSNPNSKIVNSNTNPNAKQNTVKDLSTSKNTVIDNDLPDNKVATPQKEIPKTISGGVLNGKATYLEKPTYPAAARAVRASGAVNVQVTIDEKGNVISAQAVSGHALLKASAVQAARNSKFSPTLLSGQAVKVTGVIVYNFVP